MLPVVGIWPLADRVRRIHAGHLVLGVLLASGFNAFLYPLLFDGSALSRIGGSGARNDPRAPEPLSVLAGLGLRL